MAGFLRDRLRRSQTFSVLLDPLDAEEFGADRFVQTGKRNRGLSVFAWNFRFRLPETGGCPRPSYFLTAILVDSHPDDFEVVRTRALVV